MDPDYLLLIEDDEGLREAFEVTLSMAGISFQSATNSEAAIDILSTRPGCRAVISDIRLPGMSGLTCLRVINRSWPGLPVVLMTAFADTKVAVEALKGGARDLLLKPFRPEQLVEVAKRYANTKQTPSGIEGAPVCVDPKSKLLIERAIRVSKTEATVLLLGESGTGKEVIASFIHKQSPRAKGPFVAINCAAIPATLLEATLFGYEKGAFTGASRPQPGKFEVAASGTIFLDEIGEMALDLQAKLLRILQERQVERVGSHESISLDVRIIAATNQNLATRVAEGLFREDLYYRINVFPLHIAPLRERPDDILPLAEHFLLKYRGQMGQPEARLSERTIEVLRLLPWPGNARELENVIQRGLLLCNGRFIDPEDMSLDAINATRQISLPVSSRFAQAINQIAYNNLDPIHEGDSTRRGSLLGEDKSQSGDAGRQPSDVKDLEREHILKILKSVNGHRKRAVNILGISERTLRYKLKQWREAGYQIP